MPDFWHIAGQILDDIFHHLGISILLIITVVQSLALNKRTHDPGLP